MKIIDDGRIENTKRIIKDTSEKPVIVEAKEDHYNRKLLEYGKFDILLDIEKGARKDSLKQLDSGFNHVLGREASKNKVALGIDLDKFRILNKKEKAIKLGRIIQNIKVIKKTKTKIKLLNIKDKKDSFSLLESLGASSGMATEALDF